MYANLILSYWEMMYTNDLITEQQLKDMLSERMGGGYCSCFGKHIEFFDVDMPPRLLLPTQVPARMPRKKGNKNLRFHEIADDIFETQRNGQLDVSLQSNLK